MVGARITPVPALEQVAGLLPSAWGLERAIRTQAGPLASRSFLRISQPTAGLANSYFNNPHQVYRTAQLTADPRPSHRMEQTQDQGQALAKGRPQRSTRTLASTASNLRWPTSPEEEVVNSNN